AQEAICPAMPQRQGWPRAIAATKRWLLPLMAQQPDQQGGDTIGDRKRTEDEHPSERAAWRIATAQVDARYVVVAIAHVASFHTGDRMGGFSRHAGCDGRAGRATEVRAAQHRS